MVYINLQYLKYTLFKFCKLYSVCTYKCRPSIKMIYICNYFILNDTLATAVTFLSIEVVSLIPISETLVESTGVI